MAELTVNAITQDGVDQSALAVAADVAGDSVRSANGIFIFIDNADASPHTLTVAAPKASTICPPYGELPIAAIAITVPAGETRSLTIPAGFADSGLFNWTYDAVTSVTVGVFSLA